MSVIQGELFSDHEGECAGAQSDNTSTASDALDDDPDWQYAEEVDLEGRFYAMRDECSGVGSAAPDGSDYVEFAGAGDPGFSVTSRAAAGLFDAAFSHNDRIQFARDTLALLEGDEVVEAVAPALTLAVLRAGEDACFLFDAERVRLQVWVERPPKSYREAVKLRLEVDLPAA
jgi:hypothetical protein